MQVKGFVYVQTDGVIILPTLRETENAAKAAAIYMATHGHVQMSALDSTEDLDRALLDVTGGAGMVRPVLVTTQEH